MKSVLKAISTLIELFKGKKPAVIIVSVLVIVLAIFAVKKGYITEDMIDLEAIVHQVSDLVGGSADSTVVAPVIDSVHTVAADTVTVILDSTIH